MINKYFSSLFSPSMIAVTTATLALSINFWAWSLIGPLGLEIASELSLDPIELSIILAIPIILGSITRIPFGILTDRYGGHLIFSTVCFIAIIPVIMLSFSNTYNEFLIAGILLGITGATFAIGIPFVNSWVHPKRRGLMLGIYSMGNAGVAISGFITPQLANTFSREWSYLIVAFLLFIMGIIFIIFGKNSPNWKKSNLPALKILLESSRSRNTWDLSLLYFISFGAFVAFGVYLPTLLSVSYGLPLTDAAARAAGFILLATVSRPIGGSLSDKFGEKNVIKIVFLAISILSAFVALQPTLAPTTTIAYLSLAVFLGLGNGSIFAAVGRWTEVDRVGSVAGIVGASGGLGGFFPPLVLGITYQITQSYSFALLGLSLASGSVLLYIYKRFKRI